MGERIRGELLWRAASFCLPDGALDGRAGEAVAASLVGVASERSLDGRAGEAVAASLVGVASERLSA
jgi:hypothetical protein